MSLMKRGEMLPMLLLLLLLKSEERWMFNEQ
jgi:hypothetical protein